MSPRVLGILLALGWVLVVWFLMHHLGCSTATPC